MPTTLADAAATLNRMRTRPPTFREDALPSLVMVTDRRMRDPLAVAARLPMGSAILLRPYAVDRAEELGRALKTIAQRRHLKLIVAADVPLAARLRADGLHLPEGLARHGHLAPALMWRKRTGGLLTIACHSPLALRRAEALGADAALLSPVFPTASHPGAATLGPLRTAAWTVATGLPVIALGGLTPATAQRLRGSTIHGIAAINGLQRGVAPPFQR